MGLSCGATRKKDRSTSMSNLTKHARRELALRGDDPETVRGYLDMIEIFAAMGHSGGSASVFIPTLTQLLSFQNLMPLTSDPSEWYCHTGEGSYESLWQNVRNSSAFSHDGGETYYLVDDPTTVMESARA